MEFLLNQTFEIENVISLSGQYSFDQYPSVITELNNQYKEHKRIDNYIITTTKSIQNVQGKEVLDVELLLPINSVNITIYKPCIFKEKILIKNAIYTTVQDINLLQNVLNELNLYMINNKLQPITSAYLVQQKKNQVDQIEIYIGINPNIL